MSQGGRQVLHGELRTTGDSQSLLNHWKLHGAEGHAFQVDLFELLRAPLARGARIGLTAEVGRDFSGQDIDDAASAAAEVVFATDPHTIGVGIEQFAFGVARNKGREVGRRLRRLRDRSALVVCRGFGDPVEGCSA